MEALKPVKDESYGSATEVQRGTEGAGDAARFGSTSGFGEQGRGDDGIVPGLTTADAQRIADLEREVRELRRANEILKAASAFFAAELDRPYRS